MSEILTPEQVRKIHDRTMMPYFTGSVVDDARLLAVSHEAVRAERDEALHGVAANRLALQQTEILLIASEARVKELEAALDEALAERDKALDERDDWKQEALCPAPVEPT